MPEILWRTIPWAESWFYSTDFPKEIKKPTVLERIKKMWERSNYYKTLPKPPVLTPSGPKPKPYYRIHERW